MLVQIGLLLLGFAFLVKGARWLVDGSIEIAKKFRLSELAVGLTLVAFGTSAPEIFINFIANFKGQMSIGFGNAVGANISNLLLVAGLAALIRPIKIKKEALKRDLPFGLLAIGVLIVLANDFSLSAGSLVLDRFDGLLLLIFFAAFIYLSAGRSIINAVETPPQKKPLGHAPLNVVIGIAALAIGGQLAVNSAAQLANFFGLSQGIIGLTVVSLGTTLPELFASVTAAYKKEGDLAIGNIVGSVVFNLGFILGLNALIKPFEAAIDLNFGLLVSFLATLLFFYFILFGKKERMIERYEGALLLVGYFIYLFFVFSL